MSPYILFTMLFSLGLGTTLTFACTHWFVAWIGLEINTLAIIPLMAQHHHPRATEAATKYFLTQATAASVLLFAATSNAWLTGQWHVTQVMHPMTANLMALALALKIGLAPIHAWLPEVLQGLDLTTGLILTTWQKLAPMALLVQIQHPNSTLLVVLGLTSVLIGGWGGMNQTQLRKMLAYSSIAQLGWMVAVLPFYPSLTFLALFIYIFTTTAMFLLLKLNKATNINALATSFTKNPMLTSLSPLVLLSLGGLPPLTGFMPKWLILREMTSQDLPLLATLISIAALLSLFFYVRIAYAMTMTAFPNNLTGTAPWRLRHTQPTLILALMVTIATTLLPLMPAATSTLTL
uniref:NADH-ubiquinone oxidoreductase chain 2 n=1 Tax=Apistus carinatus TaxID=990932 RepID=A0A679DMZ4_9TELE|nr:NADH dehydrogenase subunit 2 [Apistus carinatus]